MNVSFRKEVNKNKDNRVEFCLRNFDYFDGIDLLAKIFNEEYGHIIGEKLDVGWIAVIELSSEENECTFVWHLVWHEDWGIFVYSENQDEESVAILESQLSTVIGKLNAMIESINTEMKGYILETASDQERLINEASKIIKQKAFNLPEEKRQILHIDIRGQNVTETQLAGIERRIMQKCNTKVEIKFVGEIK